MLAEFGTELPEEVEVRVHDSTADLRYIVLPRRPEGSEDLDEDALAASPSSPETPSSARRLRGRRMVVEVM